MLLVTKIILLLLFITVIYQDLKYRVIHFILLPVIFGVTLFKQFEIFGYIDIKELIFNFLFIVVLFSVLILFYSVKYRKMWNPLKESIGIGDVLFFFAVIPLFALKSLMLFFTLGLFFSILFHLLMNVFRKQETVPLAGYLSIFIISIGLIESLMSINLFSLKI